MKLELLGRVLGVEGLLQSVTGFHEHFIPEGNLGSRAGSSQSKVKNGPRLSRSSLRSAVGLAPRTRSSELPLNHLVPLTKFMLFWLSTRCDSPRRLTIMSSKSQKPLHQQVKLTEASGTESSLNTMPRVTWSVHNIGELRGLLRCIKVSRHPAGRKLENWVRW